MKSVWIPMAGLRRWAAAAFLGVLAGCGGGDGHLPDVASLSPTRVETASGPVDAVQQNGMLAYRRIPYAAPPTGALRWQAPADPQPWTDPIRSETSANTCPQNSASPFVIASTNEDCLYLDVFAPGTRPAAALPVMVWIHGGAFLTGGAVTYGDPSPLVSRGVIVVNMNYRLGAFGFLAHPALSAEQGGSSGNYGIMDQQAALRWVQKNIAGFGGDPNNVTIFGESAGGFSVITHLASPGSKGLFQKALIESGAYAINSNTANTLAASQTVGTSVVNNTISAAGASCPAPVTVDCMRSLPVTTLLTEYGKLNSSPIPNVDGRVLPKSVRATFAAGENNKVPVVNGSNRDEWALFLAITEQTARNAVSPPNNDPANTSFALSAAAYPYYLGALANLQPPGTPASGPLLAAYPLASYGSNTAQQPSLAATAFGTDLIFSCNALRFSQRVQAQSSPIWMYEFRDRTAQPSVGNDANGNYSLSFPQGAAHSYELQYVFNLRDLGNDERRTLQSQMATYWTNFAKSSDPNNGNAVAASWPAFTGTDKVLGLDVASDGGIQLLTTFEADHKCTSVWGSAVTF